MQNDEIREDVTPTNDIEEVEETQEEETTEDTQEEVEEKDWQAEAKKWEAIAKRKAKKAEQGETTEKTESPAQLDQELVELTYKNYLGNIGITNTDVQDEAISLAKRMGMPVSQIQSDPAMMALIKEKQKIAETNKSVAGGTGGAATRKKDVDYYASQITQGKGIDKISGKEAVALLKKLKGGN